MVRRFTELELESERQVGVAVPWPFDRDRPMGKNSSRILQALCCAPGVRSRSVAGHRVPSGSLAGVWRLVKFGRRVRFKKKKKRKTGLDLVTWALNKN